MRRVLQLVTTPLPTADMYRLDPLVPRAYWNEKVRSFSATMQRTTDVYVFEIIQILYDIISSYLD